MVRERERAKWANDGIKSPTKTADECKKYIYKWQTIYSVAYRRVRYIWAWVSRITIAGSFF